MANPEELTKEQLKEELLANGIEIPSGNHRKSVFIELYKKHIYQKLQEFSSDDNIEVQSSSSKRSARLANRRSVYPTIPEMQELNSGDKENIKVYVVAEQDNSAVRNHSQASFCKKMKKGSELESLASGDKKAESVIGNKNKVQKKQAGTVKVLEDLTNEEIAARLKSYGQFTGPVVSSTRKVYLKKLNRLVQNEEQYSDTEEEVDVEAVPTVAVTRSSSRRKTMQFSDHLPVVTSRRSSSSTNKRRSVSVKVDPETSLSQPAIALTGRRPLRSSVKVEKLSQTTASTTVVEEEVSEELPKQMEDPPKSKIIKPERKWIPVWFQITITLVVFLFAYLVIQTMENASSQLTLPLDG